MFGLRRTNEREGEKKTDRQTDRHSLRKMLFALAGPGPGRGGHYLERRRVDKAMDGWTMVGRTDG